MSPEAIEKALLEENAQKCDPPLPEEKVRAIAHDIPKRYQSSPRQMRPGSRSATMAFSTLVETARATQNLRYGYVGVLTLLPRRGTAKAGHGAVC